MKDHESPTFTITVPLSLVSIQDFIWMLAAKSSELHGEASKLPPNSNDAIVLRALANLYARDAKALKKARDKELYS